MDLQLTLLQNWYATQCNGDWEHSYGIEITTLDNPGWSLQIQLYETELQDVELAEIQLDRSEQDWLFCSLNPEKTIFHAACGPHNLVEVLQIFND